MTGRLNEFAFGKAIRNFARASGYSNEWLDQSGMPSFVAYVRSVTGQMPDIFPLNLTRDGGIVITAFDKREFSVVPFDTDDHDRWELVVVGDDTGVRSMELDMAGWKSEDRLIEKLFLWCRLHCPPEDLAALDQAEDMAARLIMKIRTEQAKTMPPPAPGWDADPF